MTNSGRAQLSDSERERISKEAMQGLLDAMVAKVKSEMGNPQEKLEGCATLEFDAELYQLLRRMGPEDTKALKEMLMLAKGQKLKEDASHSLLKVEHLLADYGSAQTIGRFIKIFWVVLLGVVGFVFGVVKALPDMVDVLRGWLK